MVKNEIAIRDFDYLSRCCKSLRICDCATVINYSNFVCNGILYVAGPFVKKFSWGYTLKIFGSKSTQEFFTSEFSTELLALSREYRILDSRFVQGSNSGSVYKL